MMVKTIQQASFMKSIPMAYFESKYTLNRDGTIISHQNNKPIKPTQNPNGYYKYTFTLNGLKKQMSIHQVIAQHFLPNPYNYKQVNHLDGNKQNNSVSNLEWSSPTNNVQHALKIGLRKGYMPFDDKCKYLTEVLAGTLIKNIAKRIGRREETLSKMLRKTAIKLGKQNEWKQEMQRRRKITAKQNITTYNTTSN